MEVDEIQQQVCKFQRIVSNGSATTHNSSNPNNKIATTTTTASTAMATHKDLVCGWPSSRIVRVSRASGGKDRHSKVLTSKGLRDRRVRLSVTTAIQFYDLQDRLGYDQPSKAVEWLIKAASASIAELPSLDPPFPTAVDCSHRYHHHRKPPAEDRKETEFEDPSYQQTNNVSVSKSCSSTSETSKGSGLSLSRSENRVKARERAREMAAKKEKEKEKESDPTRVINGISQNSSFTDLLTGGGAICSAAAGSSPNNSSNPADNNNSPPDSRIHWTTPMDYFFNRPPPQLPQFGGENHPHHHFSFLQENFSPATAGGGGGGEGYNLNFSISSSSSGGGFATGFNRGTLQSNLVSVLPHNHQHVHQRFQSSSMVVDGSTSTNFPLFMGQTIGSAAPESFPATGYDSQRLQLYDGGRHKEKSKN